MENPWDSDAEPSHDDDVVGRFIAMMADPAVGVRDLAGRPDGGCYDCRGQWHSWDEER